MEAMLHSTRLLTELMPTRVLIKLDIKNAFNMFKRTCGHKNMAHTTHTEERVCPRHFDWQLAFRVIIEQSVPNLSAEEYVSKMVPPGI